jgi:delta 1-pyrroline-5-carboxylate dehydrogenase
MEEFTTFANIINGGPASASHFTQGIDPSTKQKLWDVPVATPDDLELAISSAQTAFKSWSKTTWSHRQASLTAARDILVENKEKLAVLLTKEGGKPVSITVKNKIQALSLGRFNSPTWRSSIPLTSYNSMVRKPLIRTQEFANTRKHRKSRLKNPSSKMTMNSRSVLKKSHWGW